MKVNVTQEHIDKGIPCLKNVCLVSLAILDAGYKRAWVDEEAIWLYNPKTNACWTFKTPHKAAEFIGDFDNDREVSPFEFDLDDPIPEDCP